MTEFGTTWSKSVGVIALLWFVFYVFVDIINFGADASARDRFLRFSSNEQLSKEYRNITYFSPLDYNGM